MADRRGERVKGKGYEKIIYLPRGEGKKEERTASSYCTVAG